MNRISNLFATFRSIALSLGALLRWLSEDKTTAQLAEVFATATKIAARVIKFYADNASTAQKAAKVVCKAADELAEVVPEFAANCESYVSDLTELQGSMKPKATEPKTRKQYTKSGKYSKKPASITVLGVTPRPRSASASSPVCTPTDCALCDKPCANPLPDCERSGIRK
jgi:hypothetical protein